MPVYPTSPFSTRMTWPDRIESIWQMLPGGESRFTGWKRPDIGLCDRLFIGAVVNLPKETRGWGAIQWLGEVYQTSRPTLYAIGERTKAELLNPGYRRTAEEAEIKLVSANKPETKTVVVTPNRLIRTALTLQFPVGSSERSAEDCLEVALDMGRSPAFLSRLFHEAGQRAGEILEKVDHTPLGPAMQARDELFVGRDPILLMVEPHSLVITGLYATSERDAETWGCVLLLTQDRQVQIQGLAEDHCIPYAASCKIIHLDAAIQKDVWHPLADVGK